MAQSARLARSDNFTAGVLGAAVVVGLGVAAVSYSRQRSSGARVHRSLDKGANLAAYLREHLTGADAAIQVVDRLRLVHAGTQEGRLFAALFDEFREERDVVRALLDEIGATPLSLKRLAGQASGAAGQFAAGGERGDLSLFRTLEALAVGVQGKRCMWRALQSLLGDQPIPSVRTLAGLEAMAVRQWEAIEERRRGLVLATFPAMQLPEVDAPID
jgi:hypothetical protein